MHTEKRQDKVSFHSGHGSLGASRSLPVADTGKLASMYPSVPPQKKTVPSPPRTDNNCGVGQVPQDTHALDKRVAIVPKAGEDIPTQGDNRAQAVLSPYLSGRKHSRPEKILPWRSGA